MVAGHLHLEEMHLPKTTGEFSCSTSQYNSISFNAFIYSDKTDATTVLPEGKKGSNRMLETTCTSLV